MLYGRLDERRADTARRLQSVLHDETVGTPQALTERDAAAAMYTDRLAALRAAEHGLAFGRLDTETGERRYIGRLGLLDEDHDYEPLLMDWRAPAAQPFYTATAASPEGMRRRRHLRTRRREVLAVDDEVLDLDDAAAAGSSTGLDQRGGPDGGGLRPADRADGRHRRDDPGRAGPHHPGHAVRGARGAGRSGHRQDRGGPAPRGLPALHPPRPARPPRRAGRRPERHVPALHRPGAAVAGGDQRRARHGRAAVPRPGRPPGRAARGRRGQGAPGDGGCDRRGGPRPPAGAAPPGRAGRRAAAGAAGPRRRQRRAVAGPAVAPPAQRGQADLPPGGGAPAGRAGGARARRAGVARPARRRRPVRHPRRAEREPRADPRAGRAVADAVGPAAADRPVRRPAPAPFGGPAPARGAA